MKFRKNSIGDYVAFNDKQYLFIDYKGAIDFDALTHRDIERYDDNGRWEETTALKFIRVLKKTIVPFLFTIVNIVKDEAKDGL